VAAPMTARAARDTAIAGTRLEAICGATSGASSPCVSLSGASVTCVPHIAAQSRDSSHRRSAKQRAIAVTNQQWLARLPTRIRLKSWARMVNDRLFQRPADLSARRANQRHSFRGAESLRRGDSFHLSPAFCGGPRRWRTSALVRITDSRRTSRRVRFVPTRDTDDQRTSLILAAGDGCF
jgi:hypothetical protein